MPQQPRDGPVDEDAPSICDDQDECEEDEAGSSLDDEPDSAESEQDNPLDEEEQEPPPVFAANKGMLQNVQWTGYSKRVPVLIFKSESVLNKKTHGKFKSVGEKFHMTYKFVRTESRLVRNILDTHGFHEVHPNSNDFNLMWTGSHLKPFNLRAMTEFQKINHFPRSYEITRKDRLFKNVQRMQHAKGMKQFDIHPASFVLPGEYSDFCNTFLKEKGAWIVKPVASSRGRGIYVVNHPEQVPLDENVIVSRYINNPLLVDGFKFDLRLYVAVTSYDPLSIYVYEEGLTRFATVRFDKSMRHLKNHCMHLTNYSVNKKNNDYVANDDADIEDYGNKWSLGALMRYLRRKGKDTVGLMMRIEDVIVKTIICAELPIATACKMFMPFRGNCFELYGFDILVDDNLRPWVLEVNLSPSLACDAPLDLKIKANMIADLFALTGFVCQDPMSRKPPVPPTGRNADILSRQPQRTQQGTRSRPSSASSSSRAGRPVGAAGMTGDEIRAVRRIKEETRRRGGWARIFPTADSWDHYGSYLEFQTTLNLTVYQKLYPEKAQAMSGKTSSASFSSATSRTKSLHLNPSPLSHLMTVYSGDNQLNAILQRYVQYERRLGQKGSLSKLKRRLQLIGSRPSAAEVHAKAIAASKSITRTSEGSRTALAQGREVHVGSSSTTAAQPPADSHTSENQTTKSSTGSGIIEHHASKSQTAAAGDGVSVQKEEVKEDTRATAAGQTGLARRVQSQCPAPPRPPTPPADIIDLLKKGQQITKVQARTAFATYLSLVQLRLMEEMSHKDDEDTESANEQMDLVLRFLKRAAVNLQQPMKVVVPSRKLPLAQRRRILAKQLGDFIQSYSRETDVLKVKTYGIADPSLTDKELISDKIFAKFVHQASETELEDVLTTYTKMYRSASIFLGGNSTSEHARVVSAKSDRRHSDNPDGSVTSNIALVRPSSGRRDNAMSSYVSAVTIYSAKLGNRLQARPASASSQRSISSRPSSGRSEGYGATQEPTVNGTGPPARVHEAPRTRAGSRAGSHADLTNSRPPVPPDSNNNAYSKSASSRVEVKSEQNSDQKADGSQKFYSPSSLTAAALSEKDKTEVTDALQRLTMRQQQRSYTTTAMPLYRPGVDSSTSQYRQTEASSHQTTHNPAQNPSPTQPTSQWTRSASPSPYARPASSNTYLPASRPSSAAWISSGVDKRKPPTTTLEHGPLRRESEAVYLQGRPVSALSRGSQAKTHKAQVRQTLKEKVSRASSFKDRLNAQEPHRPPSVTVYRQRDRPKSTVNAGLDPSSSAYATVTGVAPSKDYQPSAGSHQMAVLSEQSRFQLESSRNKLQGVLLQANVNGTSSSQAISREQQKPPTLTYKSAGDKLPRQAYQYW